jgi:hypothetical protein
MLRVNFYAFKDFVSSAGGPVRCLLCHLDLVLADTKAREMDYEWTAAESSHGTVSNLSSGGSRCNSRKGIGRSEPTERRMLKRR